MAVVDHPAASRRRCLIAFAGLAAQSFATTKAVAHAVLVASKPQSDETVRAGRIANKRAALVFPLLCMLAGGLLLAHTHSIANFREELLVEITHVPIALLGIAAGAARWLELRMPAGHRHVAASIWPVCLLLSGLLLLTYHE